MKVFLSWSGSYTRQIAEIFSDWIPCVLQSVEAFISSGDIQAGERWQSKINAALMNIDFGVVFVTKENKDKPWIMFEAGALAKNLGDARVVPILCGAREIDFEKSPLLQFQYVHLDKEGVYSLMRSIYSNIKESTISEVLFGKSFETWWPQLESKLTILPLEVSDNDGKVKSKDEKLDRLESTVSDILGILHKMMRDENRQKNPILSEREYARYIEERANVRFGGPTSSIIPRAVRFFEVPEEDALKMELPTRIIVDQAKTKDDIDRVIKYIKANKNSNIEEKYMPALMKKYEILS